MSDSEFTQSSSTDTNAPATGRTAGHAADSDSVADELARQAAAKQTGVLAELLALLRENKKWWLLPIIVLLLLVGGLMFLSSTAVAPFIYTIF